ncbi:MAG TPA: hypothetical protein VNZ43_07635 [Sphingomonadaceae bacterium]|nr:hypothetical protein [Sphingomonadaceae bacterium]
MPQQCNHTYYLHRAEAARRLAEEASDKAVRNLHLAMANEYRARAAASPPAETEAG